MRIFGQRKQKRAFGILLCTLSFFVLTGCTAGKDNSVPEGNRQDTESTMEAGIENTADANDSSDDNNSGSNGPVTPKTFALNFRTKLNLKRMTATVKWKTVENASKYVITCSVQKKGDWEEVEEKTIPAGEKTSYQHKISVGKNYRYEVNVYQNVDGKEYYLLKPGIDNACYIDCSAPDIIWDDSDWYVDLEKGQQEFVKLAFTVPDYCFAPTGFEIYRGLPEEDMELLDTIEAAKKTKNNLYIYEDNTVQNGSPYSYKIRSYVELKGKRIYGEEAENRTVSAENFWGSCKTELIVPEQKKIDAIEVVITSQEDKVIKWGKKYTGKNMLSFFVGQEIGDTNSSLGLDEISYKMKESEEYKVLAPGDTVLINSKNKLYIQFARKDHQKFKNPVAAGDKPQIDNVCIDMFFFKGHHSFLHITDFAESVNHIKWREELAKAE